MFKKYDGSLQPPEIALIVVIVTLLVAVAV